MFEHSVKVPRNFKISANILKKVATKGGGVKNLLYDNKLRFFRTNVIYALITETIKHAADLDKLFEATGLLEKEQRLDPWLARVITTELLFGKKELPGLSKPEKTILSYKEQFEKITLDQAEVKNEVPRPRYIRINTNCLTTSDAIRAFQDEGYRFIRCTSGSYNDYLQQIQGLSEYDFTQDYHVKTMFVFHPSTKFHDHDLYLENKIVLQGKSTALPVHLLAPPPGSVVLDMCAAPGMKTTQVAAFIRNQGKVYAVERDADRYKTLCNFVEKTESKCVTTMNRDCLEIKKGECEDVEYIILDPSCSGSGMELSVHNYVDQVRLSRLTSLQEKFLKHAMNSFPNAKKIVYSTCSLFPEENERVISNVVKLSRAKWKVLNVKDLLKEQWNNFGSGMYGEMGTRCLYARPDTDLTTGFFLAVLERDPKQNDNAENHSEENNQKREKKVKSKDDTLTESVENEYDNVKECSNLTSQIKDGKKKRKLNEENDVIDADTDTVRENDEENKKRKKKKKKDKDDSISSENNLASEDLELNGNGEKPKNKKKKHRDLTKDSESAEVLESTDNLPGVEIELNTTESGKSKKKNKNNRDVSENSEANDLIGAEIPNADSDLNTKNKEKSKKKKRKNKDLSEDTQEIVESEVNESTLATDEQVAEQEVRTKKKKKKKNKDNENDTNNCIEESNTGVDCLSKKRKKTNIPTDDCLQNDGVVKKKKKNRND